MSEFMYMSTQNGCSLTTFLIETENRNTTANCKQNLAVMARDGPSPHSSSLHLSLPAPQPSRGHHAQSLLGASFHDPRHCQEHIMFLNPTPSKPRLSPTATMSDDTLLALTPPLHCTSILQPATPPQVVAFESYTISTPICVNHFTFAESRESDL